MASTCPKCHSVLEDDVVCCADLKYTWKCKSCGKLTTGFVVPYGRCFMCGGELEVVEPYSADDPDVVKVVEEATQYEVDSYQFYKLALAHTNDEQLRAVFTSLYEKEQEHLQELEDKYHMHLDERVREPDEKAKALLSSWLFDGIEFKDDDHVLAVYDKAIEMERRTRDHFKALAENLGEGTAKEIYRELAAEEEEHVALLETERAQFEG